MHILIAACVAVTANLQRYYQQILPISECTVDDGCIVGHLLLDLVDSKPKDLASAIREFVNRTAMLRECGFARMGAFLVAVMVLKEPTQVAPLERRNPVSPTLDALTEEQAAAIGRNLAATLGPTPITATAMREAVNSRTVLRAMRSKHSWFVPMLEVLLVRAADPLPSRLKRASLRLSISSLLSRSARLASVAPDGRPATADAVYSIPEPNAEESDDSMDDGDFDFDSVVRLVLPPPLWNGPMLVVHHARLLRCPS